MSFLSLTSLLVAVLRDTDIIYTTGLGIGVAENVDRNEATEALDKYSGELFFASYILHFVPM